MYTSLDVRCKKVCLLSTIVALVALEAPLIGMNSLHMPPVIKALFEVSPTKGTWILAIDFRWQLTIAAGMTIQLLFSDEHCLTFMALEVPFATPPGSSGLVIFVHPSYVLFDCLFFGHVTT